MAKNNNSVIESNMNVISTESRKILEVRDNVADIEITAGDHTDTLKNVPLNLEAALERFGKEGSRNSVFGLAISQYFTDESNYLRVNGIARENKEKKKTLETVQKLSKDEILASLTDEQKKQLGL